MGHHRHSRYYMAKVGAVRVRGLYQVFIGLQLFGGLTGDFPPPRSVSAGQFYPVYKNAPAGLYMFFILSRSVGLEDDSGLKHVGLKGAGHVDVESFRSHIDRWRGGVGE